MPADKEPKRCWVYYSVRHARKNGNDSPDHRNSAVTGSSAYLAVQHRLGLLPQRRVGINSVDPDHSSPDGQTVVCFRRTIDSEPAIR